MLPNNFSGPTRGNFGPMKGRQDRLGGMQDRLGGMQDRFAGMQDRLKDIAAARASMPQRQPTAPSPSPSTPPPTQANGIAGAFQGVNPAKAGYDVGNAAIMANQQQAQPQQPFVPTGRSQQAKDFSVLQNQVQQQFGITDPQQANMLAQQMRIGQTQDPALRQQYAQGFQQQQIMDAQKARQQQMQDLSGQLGFNYTPQSDAQLRQNAQGMQQQLLQQLGGQGGLQGQFQAGLANQQAMQTQLANQFGGQGGLNAQQANQQAFEQQLRQQNLNMQGGMGGMGGMQQLGGQPQTHANLQAQQNQYAPYGFSPELLAARQTFDQNQRQAMDSYSAQIANASPDKQRALSNAFSAQLRLNQSQFDQQHPEFMEGINAYQAKNMTPEQRAQMQASSAYTDNSAGRSMYEIDQARLGGNPYQAQLGGPQGTQLQNLGNPYQAQLYGQAQFANPFGNQGGMGLKPQGNTGTGFNLGSGPYGSAPSLAMPIINPQQPSVTSVNLPGMGVQGGMGTGMQGMTVGAPPAGMVAQQRYTPR